MKLNLKNPIIFFDLETTGINVTTDRIVEISILKIFTDGHEEIHTHKINPGIPIPPETTKIHGISDEDVKDCPRFGEIAKNIAQFIGGADIGGFNSNKFDIPLLAEHFITQICEEYGMPVKTLTTDAIAELQKRNWTGNIREFRNVVERLIILCGTEITETDVRLFAGAMK